MGFFNSKLGHHHFFTYRIFSEISISDLEGEMIFKTRSISVILMHPQCVWSLLTLHALKMFSAVEQGMEITKIPSILVILFLARFIPGLKRMITVDTFTSWKLAIIKMTLGTVMSVTVTIDTFPQDILSESPVPCQSNHTCEVISL